MTATYSGGGGRVSAAVRVNDELRPVATEFPAHSVFPIYSITKTLTAMESATTSVSRPGSNNCGPNILFRRLPPLTVVLHSCAIFTALEA